MSPTNPNGQGELPLKAPPPARIRPPLPTFTQRNIARKWGPNDECPCGSGKKLKKCCREVPGTRRVYVK